MGKVFLFLVLSCIIVVVVLEDFDYMIGVFLPDFKSLHFIVLVIGS